MDDSVPRIAVVRLSVAGARQVRIAESIGLSRRDRCVECGEEVMVAKTTEGKIAEGYLLTCMECLGVTASDLEGMVLKGEVKIEPEQFEALAAYKMADLKDLDQCRKSAENN